MAPGIASDAYKMSNLDLHDSPTLAPTDSKPLTPPPMHIADLDKSPSSKARGPTGQPPQRQTSYTSMRRDILYGAINEFKLTGSKLSAYDDLLSRLNFDLTPTVSQGHTWFSCKGRREDHSACPRLVPEIYFRTAVGRLLKAADKTEARGDDLTEELAAALSYAICSEHNRNIHKVVRAIKYLPVVAQWRDERASSRAATPNTSSSQPSSIKDAPISEPALTTTSPPTSRPAETSLDSLQESTPTKPLDIRGRIKVERPYPEFFRESNRERRSGSIVSAGTNSTSTSSARSKSVERRLAERLGWGK